MMAAHATILSLLISCLRDPFSSLSMEEPEWQMTRVSIQIKGRQALQMYHRLGVDALVCKNIQLGQK